MTEDNAAPKRSPRGPQGASFVVFTMLASVLLMQLVAFAMQSAPTLVTAAVSQIVALAGLGTWFVWIMGLRPTLGVTSSVRLVGAALVGVGLAFLGASLVVFVTELGVGLDPSGFGVWANEREAAYYRMLQPDRPSVIPLVILVMAVVPSLSEEFFYRGVLWEFAQRLSPPGRIALIAVLFAVAHLDPIAFLPLLIVGWATGLLRERTGGWGIAAAAHFVLNVLGATVVPRLPEAFVDADLFLFGALAGGSLATLIGLRLVGRGEAMTVSGGVESAQIDA